MLTAAHILKFLVEFACNIRVSKFYLLLIEIFILQHEVQYFLHHAIVSSLKKSRKLTRN